MGEKSDVSIGDVDKWIAQLYECKPLSEVEIKRLCEKVRAFKDLGPCQEPPSVRTAPHPLLAVGIHLLQIIVTIPWLISLGCVVTNGPGGPCNSWRHFSSRFRSVGSFCFDHGLPVRAHLLGFYCLVGNPHIFLALNYAILIRKCSGQGAVARRIKCAARSLSCYRVRRHTRTME